jgi:hypothetical protein
LDEACWQNIALCENHKDDGMQSENNLEGIGMGKRVLPEKSSFIQVGNRWFRKKVIVIPGQKSSLEL